MNRLRSGFWLLLFLPGCYWHLTSHDLVTLQAPIVTSSRVSLDLAPTPEGGPVVEMPLGGCCRCGPKVAVIDVDGLLLDTNLTGPYSVGENPLALFREKLDAIAADRCVAAVVLRINSPGGGVTPSDLMWRDLQAFRSRTHLPVIACLCGLGTGGAYYLATAADLVVASPTTVVGGIGVILNLYNLRETMAQLNVLPQPIKAGPNIDMGTASCALSDETRKLLQAMADEYHARFKQIVRAGRPAVDADDAATFDGRVFTASQALDRHLIDRIGYPDDALTEASRLAGVTDASVVLFHRANDPVHSLYSTTPNVPVHTSVLPVSIPGLDRTRLPTFLYLWQAEPTVEKLAGR